MKRPGISLAARLLVSCAALLATGPGIADMAQPQFTCPSLLMETECHEFLTQMKAAPTPALRDAVQQRYAPMLKERGRLCHASTGGNCKEVIITPRMMTISTQGKRTAL